MTSAPPTARRVESRLAGALLGTSLTLLAGGGLAQLAGAGGVANALWAAATLVGIGPAAWWVWASTSLARSSP